ncbi:MAG: endonuclease Q family protein [Candidatus Levyibacteriota bacterium]
MELVLDLHLHSRFSRAVSPRMNLPNMYLWGRKKGINILSVADFTHPVWFKEVFSQLEEFQPGIFKLKDRFIPANALPPQPFLGPYFMLSVEVAAIYSENGKVHRIHNLILSPDFETAEKVNKGLVSRGINLSSDGRPILGISSRNLAEMLFEINPRIVLIPCHVWTPWFSLYGSKSGYDHITDCFGEYAKYIFAIETGLSSDPSMNWRIKELDTRSIVSFSDAHSLEKMGREATVLRSKNQESRIKDEDITYSNIMNGLVRGKEKVFELGYTIEFYPEEGKYHYTGHRNCKVSYSPDETPKDKLCPVCRRPLTVGVMHRVEDLASNPSQNFTLKQDGNGVVWIQDVKAIRPPSVNLVPLLEVIAEAIHSMPSSQKVLAVFDSLVQKFSTEHEILLRTSLDEIRKLVGNDVAEGVEKVRSRNISIIPGFDGEYGKVAIWNAEDGILHIDKKKTSPQMGLEL